MAAINEAWGPSTNPVSTSTSGPFPVAAASREKKLKHQRELNEPRVSRDATLHAMRRCTHTYMLHLTISLIQLDTCHVRKSTNTPAHRTAWGNDAQTVQTVR